MTNNTIPNVPRELLERVASQPARGKADYELRALLSAPSPAGVDELSVVATVEVGDEDRETGVCDNLDIIPCDVPFFDGEELCRLSDAQAIIDGLRGEVERVTGLWELELARAQKAENELAHAVLAIDQQAQRIGKLVEVLRIAGGAIKEICTERNVPLPSSTLRRIDAALSAGKEVG